MMAHIYIYVSKYIAELLCMVIKVHSYNSQHKAFANVMRTCLSSSMQTTVGTCVKGAFQA